MTIEIHSTAEYAEILRKQGVNCGSIKRSYGKKQLDGWKENQTSWCSLPVFENDNLICYLGFNNYYVVDIDKKETPEIFKEFFDKTLVVQTGRGGHHIWLRQPDDMVPPTTKLYHNNIQVGDLKGLLGYVIGPGSIHENGNLYQVVSPTTTIMKYNFKYIREKFEALGWTANSKPISEIIKGVSDGERNDSAYKYARYLINDKRLEEKTAWYELTQWNQLNTPPIDESELKTTFRSALNRGVDQQTEKIKPKETNSIFNEALILLETNDKKEAKQKLIEWNKTQPAPESDTYIDTMFSLAVKKIKDGIKQENNEGKEQKEKPRIKKVKGTIGEYYVESILKDNKPFFICVKNGDISFKESIEDEDKIYRPLEPEECGYFSYHFTTEELEKLTNTTLSKENLLNEIKEKIDYYIDLGDIDKNLILIDLFLSYCQEWINTIHFPYFVGETESGKSTALHLFKHLGYRCLLSEDLPDANIYNFLGLDEEGTGTICEDEAQDLALDKDKIRTYKSSYSRGSVKPRVVNSDSKDKKQVYYKTFCFKLFAGEKVPDDKGFRERLAIVHMTEGLPSGNIKRVSESEKYVLEKLRNALLIWKIQNIKTGLEKHESGLTKRDQELWEDFLTVAYGTKYYDKAKEVSEYYVKQRHQSIWNSLEARIFKILKESIDKDKNEIISDDFWQELTQKETNEKGIVSGKGRNDFKGTLDKLTFFPNDFNRKVTRNTIAKLFEDKFQGVKHTIEDKTDAGKRHQVTKYQFKKEILDKLSIKYNTAGILDDS